ncbi:hypothetical protein ACE5IS_19390 [Leptospira wolffii]|uniref:Lipoprotein n=1 Tax=Leptospira wolffii TaxID=409998 RepID=A0ABV5BUH9_9LEPT
MPIWCKFKLYFLIPGAWLCLVGCLPYIKKATVTNEKELSRVPAETKVEHKLDYQLTKTGILFKYSEAEVTYEKVKKEVDYSISKSADTSSKSVSCIIKSDQMEKESYWHCILLEPIKTMGLGYAISIPAMLVDWISYPFVIAFAGSKTETLEEIVPAKRSEVSDPKVKVRLENEELKFDKTFSFKNGKVEVPFSILDANFLWRSQDEKIDKSNYYFFSIVDNTGKEILPKEAFNGLKFRNDQNFLALATKDYEKTKQSEFKRCSKRFSLDNIRDGYKYFDDNGLFLRENELVVQVIINRACYDYRGTDSFDDCVDDFKSCASTARYLDNKNNQYKK